LQRPSCAIVIFFVNRDVIAYVISTDADDYVTFLSNLGLYVVSVHLDNAKEDKNLYRQYVEQCSTLRYIRVSYSGLKYKYC